MVRPADSDVRRAVEALRRGEAIGLPTETVYGLAADASNEAAVQRLFALKGRPADHPVIVHLASARDVDRWAANVPEAARRLADAFWPGPLTLILPRAAHVHDVVTGGQSTVGLRVPSHPVARQVLAEFGGGLAAPSANRFGRVSPTSAAHVLAEFGDEVRIVLDGGPCEVGIESTIVEVTERGARILRPGHFSAADLAVVLGREPAGADPSSPRVPGALRAHYAPRTPVELVSTEALRERAGAEHGDCRVLALGPLPEGRRGVVLGSDPRSYARGLYAALRALDHEGASKILVEAPPETPAWVAVRDRLHRAAAGSGIDDADEDEASGGLA